MLRFVVVLLSARASNTWGATAPQPIEEGTALAPTESEGGGMSNLSMRSSWHSICVLQRKCSVHRRACL